MRVYINNISSHCIFILFFSIILVAGVPENFWQYNLQVAIFISLWHQTSDSLLWIYYHIYLLSFSYFNSNVSFCSIVILIYPVHRVMMISSLQWHDVIMNLNSQFYFMMSIYIIKLEKRKIVQTQCFFTK